MKRRRASRGGPPARALAARLAVARRVAREAGARARRSFRSPRLRVLWKDDGSPVTAADRAAEDLLRRRIAAAFPGDAILGEERGETAGRSGWRWVLDPIDGTRAFVRGIPTWGALVAVEWHGRPAAGVAAFPALDEELWASRGGGAFWRDGRRVRRARVSREARLGRALIETLGGPAYRKAGLCEAYRRLSREVGTLRGWSDAYAFALVATGRAEGVVDFGLARWDVAPFAVILPEAGGRLSAWDGRSSLSTRRFLASNGRLHARLVAALRRFAARS